MSEAGPSGTIPFAVCLHRSAITRVPHRIVLRLGITLEAAVVNGRVINTTSVKPVACLAGGCLGSALNCPTGNSSGFEMASSTGLTVVVSFIAHNGDEELAGRAAGGLGEAKGIVVGLVVVCVASADNAVGVLRSAASHKLGALGTSSLPGLATAQTILVGERGRTARIALGRNRGFLGSGEAPVVRALAQRTVEVVLASRIIVAIAVLLVGRKARFAIAVGRRRAGVTHTLAQATLLLVTAVLVRCSLTERGRSASCTTGTRRGSSRTVLASITSCAARRRLRAGELAGSA